MATENSQKLNKLNWLLYVAIGLLLSTLGFYFYNFNNGLTSESSNWGAFGDFMGGTLNPIFALFSLFAIIYTIKIQTQELEFSREELKATKEELEKSRIAQEEQSNSFRIQNKSISIQTFENNFYQLINLFSNARQNLSIEVQNLLSYRDDEGQEFRLNNQNYESDCKIFDNEEKVFSYEAIKKYLLIFKDSYSEDYNEFNDEFEGYTGAYFGQIYQIIKFIDRSEIYEKQRYINILRAQFIKEELELLFYHCLGEVGKRKFKPLLEVYEFFEHITHIEKKEEISKPLSEYEISVYGKNESLRKMHKDYKDSKSDKYWNVKFDD